MDWLYSLWNEIKYHVKHKYNKYLFDNVKDANKINSKDKTIYIMLHGLNNFPSQFIYLIRGLQNKENISYFTPRLLSRGNKPLEYVGNDVIQQINDVLSEFEQKPNIVLVGISNGCRISLWIYNNLHKIYNIEHIYLIVGPLRGSLMANLLINSGLYYLLGYDKDFLNELIYKNFYSAQLLKTFNLNLINTNTCITTFSADQDTVVYPSTSSIIFENNNINYSGYGHDSVIPKASEYILSKVKI